MSLSAVPHAAKPGSQKDTEIGAMAAVFPAKCFGQHAHIVAKIPKYHLNLVRVVGRCVVAIAIINAD
jgi:hypothetical protein